MSSLSPQEYYSTPGPLTDPGEYGYLLDGLPHGLPELAAVVQGLLLHPFETDLYDVDLTSEQRKELQIRPASGMLKHIYSMDRAPLATPRPPKERLIGNCRDFATLFCTLLRHQGVPARVRVGFASYFGRGHFVENFDHWITEVWDAAEGRWRLVDSQIDDLQRKKHGITFDCLDLGPHEFYTAGRAWLLCKEGKAKSGSFGFNNHLRGSNYIRGSIIRDLAALNKVETLAWDMWWELGRKGDESLTPDERELVDELARLTAQAGDEQFDDIRIAYDSDPQFVLAGESQLRMLGLVSNQFSVASKKIPQAGQFSRMIETKKNEIPASRRTVREFRKPALAAISDPANIVVRGAAQHNLKHIDVTIPRYKMVVLTGVSGSGKSSLAFDTLYAEGQRRYVESLSSYVRRYLEQMDKPKVDYIGGLSPAIAIEQKGLSHNPRSTVATVTEVMDYLRVLFSRAGTQHCPECGRPVEALSPQQIAGRLAEQPTGTAFQILAPLVRNRKADHSGLLEGARRDGFSRARLDGQVLDLGGVIPRLRKTDPHTIELVVDRLVIPYNPGNGDSDARREWDDFYVRLIDSVETALKASKGSLAAEVSGGDTILLTEQNACPYCDILMPKLTASLFSFNAPSGMCPECNGLGTRLEVDKDLIIDHPELSLMDGGCRWYGNLRKKKNKYWLGNLETLAAHYGVDINLPWKDLPKSFQDVILYGSGDVKIKFEFGAERDDRSWKGEVTDTFKGIIFHINRLFRQTKSEYTRRWYVSFMSHKPCAACGGTRLCPEARFVTVGGRTFPEVLGMTIEQAYDWVCDVIEAGAGEQEVQPDAELTSEQYQVVGEVLKELSNRLRFMLNVGLHYLSLDRAAPTLSGGEGQRIRLASSLGCGLVGVLYILDEPSIGLHARDQRALLETLLQLRDMGNTVLVVEHDAETMRAADWLVDLGPGAGVLGGYVVSAGTPDQVAADPNSLTGRYLSGLEVVTAPNMGSRRPSKGWISLEGARLFNLKNITARFPVGAFTCITGVSGSGKSSLISETLYPILMNTLQGAQATPGPYERINGLEQVDKVISITQDPIGRTPRSNPATYVGVFNEIRNVFAATPEARVRGYKADRFSFNVKGGRCETCAGHGFRRVEMHFLADVWVQCQECKGQRYNRHTLEVKYKGKNIAEVLEMDVQEALVFFSSIPAIARSLQTLHDVGLDYVKLGQSATTLSGGEAQRVKLAKELSRASTGRTVYILDEPTTGLHFADIQRLLDVLHRLVDAGNTVLVIEHNLDVIKTADWIIDMGPEGGAAGGRIIAEGTPEEVAAADDSYTGQCLKEVI